MKVFFKKTIPFLYHIKRYYELLLLCKHTTLVRRKITSLSLSHTLSFFLSFSHHCEASLRIEERERQKQDSKKCFILKKKWKIFHFLKATTTRKRESFPFSLYVFLLFSSLWWGWTHFEDHVTAGVGRVKGEREKFHISRLHNRQIRVILVLETLFFRFISCATLFFPCSI